MYKIKTYKRLTALITGCLLIILIGIFHAGKINAQVFSVGYKSNGALQRGMLVKEVDKQPNKVEALSQESLDKLKGVVVSQKQSTVNLYTPGQQVFVAYSGTFEALVSDENGDIKQGDYISISSLPGVAMKANADQSLVLGRAASNFNDSSIILGKTTSGDRQVKFGRIQVDISIGENPLIKEQKSNTAPQFIQNIATSIAGKPVNLARVWIAAIIFLATSVIAGVMIYGGIKNSLIAIGRNPLSKGSISRGLFQVVLFSLLIFITGLFAVYLLLRL